MITRALKRAVGASRSVNRTAVDGRILGGRPAFQSVADRALVGRAGENIGNKGGIEEVINGLRIRQAAAGIIRRSCSNRRPESAGSNAGGANRFRRRGARFELRRLLGGGPSSKWVLLPAQGSTGQRVNRPTGQEIKRSMSPRVKSLAGQRVTRTRYQQSRQATSQEVFFR
jgi:hypothetical protein